MKYEKNDERDKRIKDLAFAGIGIGVGAFLLKSSGSLNGLSKVAEAIEKSTKNAFQDFALLSRKELTYDNISKVVKKEFLDNDSTFKNRIKSDTVTNINQSSGLLSAVRKLSSIEEDQNYLIRKIADNVQTTDILKDIAKIKPNADEDFMKQAHILVQEVINNKQRYFQSEGETIKAVKDEFNERLNDSLFKDSKKEIIDIFETAINNSSEILQDVNGEYTEKLKPQLVDKYKEEIINKYSKAPDFIKNVQDQAAKVKDFIEAYDNNIIEHSKSLDQIYDMLNNAVINDPRFNELYIDKTLRVDKNKKLYSTKVLEDVKDKIHQEVSETIPGKLFASRSRYLNKKAPDFYYLGQNNFDPVLSALTNKNKDSFLLEHDFFKLSDSFYKYEDGVLSKVKEAENLYLTSGRHGQEATVLNALAGNNYTHPTDNKLLKRLDIGTKGISSIKQKVAFINKFKKDSDWLPNVANRLLGPAYKEIKPEDEKKLNHFYKDLKNLNKAYNNVTEAPSYAFLKAYEKRTTSLKSRRLLNAATAENIAENILSNPKFDIDNFHNSDLTSLLRKYEFNIESVDQIVNVGQQAFEKKAAIIMHYNDLLKREVFKEVVLSDSMEGQTRTSGYAIVKSRINELTNTSKKQRKNAIDLLHWSILQSEGNLFKKSIHAQESIQMKVDRYKKINFLLRGAKENAQEEKFISEFQKGIKKFASDNSSIREHKIKPSGYRPYIPENYVTMRKGIGPKELLKSINNNIKTGKTAESFVKQFIAGRKNFNDVTTFTMIPYHFVYRLTTPMEALGLGFSPNSTKSVLDLTGSILLKRIIPAAALIYGASYINDTTRSLTGTSFNGAFQNTKSRIILGKKNIDQALGLHESNKNKGSYNPFYKYWSGDYMTADEYRDYLYNGYDPVRKGRFWSFGSTTEFRGSKISYWKPNDFRLAHSDYYNKNVYGSADNKWAHSWIPTPTHPLAPLRRLMDPYWLEEMHYNDRPYPVSGKLFSDGTPWGAVLNPTIGEIIKPQKKMHQRELQGTAVDIRTIMANMNKHIKERSSNRSMVKLNNGGFTPMEYVPLSMPDTSDAVYSINTKKGHLISAGFEGKDYTKNLPNINSVYFTVADKVSTLSNVRQAYISTNKNSNSHEGLTSVILSLFNKSVSSGIVGQGTAKALVSNINRGIFAAAKNADRGVMNELGNLQDNVANIEAENQKNDYIEKMISGDSKSDFVHDLFYSAGQLSGMYGFLAEQALPRSKSYKLENANITSFSTRFWDKSIGGIGGDFMEIARRFFPHDDHNVKQINPIRNTMPAWLPVKYQTGDPYTSIPLGDARLPGKGYESLNALHPDKYGRYGAYDRYKILADIAPLSPEYKTWRKIARKEYTDPKAIAKMDAIDKRVEEQTKQHDFYPYKFVGRKLKKQSAVIEEVTNSGKFKVVGDNRQFELAGVTPLREQGENGSYIHNYIKPGMKVTLEYEDNKYRNINDNGNISALVFNGEDNISKQMIDNKQAKENKNKSTLADEYFNLTNSNIEAGRFYERLAHIQLPYIHNKFFRIDSPMEAYKKEQIYGTPYSTWSHPIKGYVKPAFQTAWSKSLLAQGVGIGTLLLSNYASNSDWTNRTKVLAHAAFAFTNGGGLAGGILGFIPKMKAGKASRVLSNVGAVIGVGGYAFANLNNPYKSFLNFGILGGAINHQLKVNGTGAKEGALIGSLIGLGLSVAKNPGGFINSFKNASYIPKSTKKKWEIEEYYDRLEYIKWTNLYKKAARMARIKEGVNVNKIINSFEYNRDQNVKKIKKLQEQRQSLILRLSDDNLKQKMLSNIDMQIRKLQTPEQYFKMGKYTKAALIYKKAAETTIYGLNDYSSQTDVLRALPKYDRDFFMEFAKEKDPKERAKILKQISPYKRKALKVLWHENLKKHEVKDNKKYFKNHKLPSLLWAGWSNKVNIDNVKMKTIENEGMLLSDFGMYESQKDEPAYRTAPTIKNINTHNSALQVQTQLTGLLNGLGLRDVDVSVDQSQYSGIQVISNITRIAQYNIANKFGFLLSK